MGRAGRGHRGFQASHAPPLGWGSLLGVGVGWGKGPLGSLQVGYALDWGGAPQWGTGLAGVRGCGCFTGWSCPQVGCGEGGFPDGGRAGWGEGWQMFWSLVILIFLPFQLLGF